MHNPCTCPHSWGARAVKQRTLWAALVGCRHCHMTGTAISSDLGTAINQAKAKAVAA